MDSCRVRYVQDGVVAVYGEAVHTETMTSGRICERQHIADPLARLTSHVHYSGMYKLCRRYLLVESPDPDLAKTSARSEVQIDMRRDLSALSCLITDASRLCPIQKHKGKQLGPVSDQAELLFIVGTW